MFPWILSWWPGGPLPFFHPPSCPSQAFKRLNLFQLPLPPTPRGQVLGVEPLVSEIQCSVHWSIFTEAENTTSAVASSVPGGWRVLAWPEEGALCCRGGAPAGQPPGAGLSLLYFLWLNLSSWQACP